MEMTVRSDGCAGTLLVKGRDKNNIILAYVSHKTKDWNEVRYEATLEDTIWALKDKMKVNDKVIRTGDFICKEVKWEDYRIMGNDNIWGSKLLKLVADKLLTQWLQLKTRLRGNDKLSRPNFHKKNMELDEGVCYECPLGKKE